uniref:Major facilitator superfamily (MFS) profile domain-containing protein n=1 Tax=Globodera rostochiensis TaxID=31243 RepID=A0A914I9J6_GLORO
MKFDDLITNYVGEFGLYQKTQLFLVCLPALITSMNALSWTFAGADVKHRCRIDSASDNVYWSGPLDAIPRTDCGLSNRSECPFEKCSFGNGKALCTETGNGYVFDRSVVKHSAIERWEFVCDRHYLKAMVQSAYYVGQMAGSLIFGFLGDRIGRKKVFFIAIVLQIIGSSGMALSPFWQLYSVFRACVGFAHPGIFVIAVIIGMELVGPTKRKIASLFTGVFFAVGQVLLGLLAYFVRDYQYLHASIAVFAAVFLSYWWVVPESARWLVSQKRYAEADQILRNAARINKRQMPEKWWDDLDEELNHGGQRENALDGGEKRPIRKHNFTDLLRTPKIRRISFSAFFCWPVVSMLYYGMSMKTDFLGGDMYMTFIFGGLVEIPALFLMYLLVDRIGRKPIISGGFAIAALCMVSNLLLGEKVNAVAIVQFLIGKASSTATYATLYTITPEMFPTVIRNMATGVCSMMARFGAILASLLMMWLVDTYGKVVIIYPFAILGICAAIVVLIFLPETTGKKFTETIDEAEGWTRNQEEMQPLSTQSPQSAKGAAGDTKTK